MISKYLPTNYWLITKVNTVNLKWKNLVRHQVNQVIRVNFSINGPTSYANLRCTEGRHITSVMFPPICKTLNLVTGTMKPAQSEAHATEYLTCVLQKSPGNKRRRNSSGLK